MFSKEECLKTTRKVIERKTKSGKVFKKTIYVQTEDLDKMTKGSVKITDKNGKNPEIITFYTRKCKPATQTINMSKEAYEYMISKDSCPPCFKPREWSAMNKKERLEAHLKRTAEHLGGTLYSYQIFGD
jgi:hypothetical protein